MSFLLWTLAFQLRKHRLQRKCPRYSVYTYLIGLLTFHINLNGNEKRITLLWAKPSQWLGCQFPQESLKGRYVLFPETLLSTLFLCHHKSQDCWGALQSVVRPRGKASGTGPEEQLRQPDRSDGFPYAIWGTLSSPHISEVLSGAKMHTFPWICDVTRIGGGPQKQELTRTERIKKKTRHQVSQDLLHKWRKNYLN